ncbi:MAG: 2-oxo acid dehydrogenase subunit E2 [Nitriliruptoraceae bacterium]|nr:2-oxo acid dehydrogenase subunit E2 [Nitriliruptoraceae bacterium]
MAHIVRIPEQGSAVESCILVGWLVEQGATVAAGDPVLEIETDKASFEVEAPADGVVHALLHDAGDEVAVHGPVAVLGAADEDVADLVAELRAGGAAPGGDTAEVAASPAEVPAPTPAEVPAPAVTPAAATPAATPPPPPAPAAPPTPAATPARPAAASSDEAPTPAAISPRAARVARRMAVDLTGVRGTGPGGRIVEADIVAAATSSPATSNGAHHTAAAAAGPAPLPDASARTVALIEREALSPIRRTIARRMQGSLIDAAQLTVTARADASRMQQLRARCREADPALGLGRVTINTMVLFAASRVLLDHPELNAHFSWDGITRFGGVNLGMAVQADRGLLVPVIQGADRRTITGIGAEAARLAERARTGKLRPEEMQGATFTVTNLGMVGVETFTPILDPPQVAILGVGAIVPNVTLEEDGPRSTPMIHLSLTFDHRALDGYAAGRFLSDVCDRIAAIDLTVLA